MTMDKTMRFSNWKANWLLPVSAAAFFFLNMPEPETHQIENYWLAIAAGFFLLNLLCSRADSLWKAVGRQKGWLLMGAVFSWATAEVFYDRWQYSLKLVALGQQLSIPVDPPWLLGVYIARVLAVVMGILSIPAVALALGAFWTWLRELFVSEGIFTGIRPREWAVYLCLAAGLLGLAVWAYLCSDAWYATGLDVVYTSDAGLLMNEKAFFLLTSPENDIRQPLFAPFAAPFLGILQILTDYLPLCAVIGIAAVEIAMLLTATLVLTRMLELDSWGRVSFLVLFGATYMSLLFSLMLEQYITAYFWLVLCVYGIWRGRPRQMVLYGAGGTLLTSMVLIIFCGKGRSWKTWLLDMVKAGLGFVAVLAVLGRFDVIYNALLYLEKLSQFTGKDVYLGGKVYQFVMFARNCFLAPVAEVRENAFGAVSWQLAPALGFNLTGLAILVLTAASALWNRKKRSSQLAAFWVAFSWVVLFVLGWGTQENGLILYALYFGWAYFVLLFQLLEKLGQTLGVKRWLPIGYLGIAAALLAVNLPQVMHMIRFMAEHYPA